MKDVGNTKFQRNPEITKLSSEAATGVGVTTGGAAAADGTAAAAANAAAQAAAAGVTIGGAAITGRTYWTKLVAWSSRW